MNDTTDIYGNVGVLPKKDMLPEPQEKQLDMQDISVMLIFSVIIVGAMLAMVWAHKEGRQT